MPDYRDYEVFKTAHDMVLLAYRVTRRFPDAEKYGLVSQLRRAATSVPTNIAEGAGRKSDRDFARFLRIAIGSTNEVEYLIRLSRDLQFVDDEISSDLTDLAVRTRQMLERLHASLGRSNRHPLGAGSG